MKIASKLTRMAGRLLDTNAVVALFGGDIAKRQLVTAAIDIFVPNIALGAFYYGAHRSRQVARNLSRVVSFAAQRHVLSCDALTAPEYGRIKQQLCAKGRPIPDNDLWIAAIAFQYQLTVITRDQHFSEVDGLQIEKW